jgi:uncharacterized protein DUF922
MRLALTSIAVLASVAVADGGGPITVVAEPERLTWSLFRKVDSMPAPAEDAHIAAAITFPDGLRIAKQGDDYRLPPFTILVAPERTRTVLRRSVAESSELLRHEQGHYDLVVLAARALARELETASSASASDLSRHVQGAVDEHTARAERLSARYDRETDKSRNAAVQARWSALIEHALAGPPPRELEGLPL